jgi:drug/metabolite transporter (DMT)-like permease
MLSNQYLRYSKMLSGKTISWIKKALEASVLMLVFTSAYLVYANWCQNVPVEVSVFWLALFSGLGAFLAGVYEFNTLPREQLEVEVDDTPRLKLLAVQLHKSLTALAGAMGSRRVFWLLLTASFFWAVYFLTLLKSTKIAGAADTMMLMQLQLVLGPAVLLILFDQERKLLRSTKWFALGLALVFAGVLLAKEVDKWSAANVRLDVLMVPVVLIVSTLVGKVIRTHLLNHPQDLRNYCGLNQPISPSGYFFFIYFTVATFSYAYVFLRGESVGLTFAEAAALAYLGIVPTAVGSIWEQSLQKKTSTAFIDGAHGTKPFLSYPSELLLNQACGALAAVCAAMPRSPSDLFLIGGCATVVGIVIAARQIKE